MSEFSVKSDGETTAIRVEDFTVDTTFERHGSRVRGTLKSGGFTVTFELSIDEADKLVSGLTRCLDEPAESDDQVDTAQFRNYSKFLGWYYIGDFGEVGPYESEDVALARGRGLEAD